MAVAAGGGGDAVGALLLHGLLPQLGSKPLIATYAWERLRVDPIPGPRGRSGFQSLGSLAGQAVEIRSGTDTRPPGRSSLPRLAAETEARLFLLDPRTGSSGLADQLTHLVEILDVEALTIVDIGGDAIAAGNERELRSPLGDALVLAASGAVGLPASVVVAGPGLDAELSELQVLDRVVALGGKRLSNVPPPNSRLQSVLRWHPTEATALLASAAEGVRGTVDMRRGDRPIPLSARSASAWTLPLAAVLAGNAQAKAVSGSRSLAAADAAALQIGPTELADEARKAENLLPVPTSAADLDIRVGQAARWSLSGGAELITTRRLAEAASVTGGETSALLTYLNSLPDARRGYLWSLRAVADG